MKTCRNIRYLKKISFSMHFLLDANSKKEYFLDVVSAPVLA